MSCVRRWRPNVPCSSWRLPTRARMWPVGVRSARTSSAPAWQQERLLEACLTLARSRGSPQRCEPVDLAAIAAEALRAHDLSGLERVVVLEPAWTSRRPGPARAARREPRLERDPPQHRRRPDRGRDPHRGGTRRSSPSPTPARSSRPQSSSASSNRSSDSTRTPGPPGDGVGLGLAIVQAIADAHDATVTAQARPGGGLGIDVAFPALD